MNKKFNLQEYLKSDEYINNKNYAKLKYFFQYLDEFFSDKIYEDNFFVLLEADDFLLALEYYIEKMNNPAQNTVRDYQRAFFSFMKMLGDYDIRNSIIFDNEKESEYKRASNDIINRLKPQENRGCLNDNGYEKLVTEIDTSLKKYGNYTEILFAIENRNSNNRRICNNSRTIYNGFVSILAIKLVILYGLKNNRVRDLTIDTLNIEKKILQIDDFELPLNDEIVDLLKMYLNIRKQSLKINDKQSKYLFVTIDGDGYEAYGQGYTSSLFAILQKKGLPNVTEVGYRRIVGLVDKGANIATLANLTGHSGEAILDLYRQERLTSKQKESLIEIIEEKKGLIKCPCCGNKSEAISDNWILRLVNVNGNQIMRIACKRCKGGIDGKYRY